MKIIKIIGQDTPRCQELFDLVRSAARSLKIEYELQKITHPSEIKKLNDNKLPVMIVDDKIILAGEIPSFQEMQKILF